MGDEVKLYGSWACPKTRRVELALKLKGVPFEFIEEDLYNKSDLVRKYNPIHEELPILVHRGRPICDSLIILEYIDETWHHHLHHNRHILHKDPYERATSRFWAKFVDEKIIPTERRIHFAVEEEKIKIKEEFHHHVHKLEELIKDREYFHDEKDIGYLDIAVVFVGHWFQVQSEVTKVELITEHKHPHLHKWLHKLHKHEHVHPCFPPRDQHLDFFKDHFESHHGRFESHHGGFESRHGGFESRRGGFEDDC